MREKKKGGCLTTFIVILLVFILAGRFGPDDFGGGSGGNSGSSTGTTEPVVDRLPNLDDSYENHIFLSARNRGECQTLKGNVMITFLLVDDTAGSWSAEAVQQFQQEVEAAGDLLEREASDNGVYLQVQHRFLQCAIGQEFTKNDRDKCADAALAAVGYSRDSASDAVEQAYQVDQAPFFMCLNQQNRSYACPADGFEYSVLYANGSDYRHELLHLFGASDYYYPDEAETLAQQFFPNSIMLACLDEIRVDELTGYLIGWTDTPITKAVTFLDRTAHLTNEDVVRDYQKEVFTGRKTDRYGAAQFTGDWVEGVPSGSGKLEYDDGSVYEGQVLYGSLEGQGSIRWSNGDSYSGQWHQSSINGYGTYTWSNGTRYEGQWVNGQMEGQGTTYFPDGSVQSGTWSGGELVG